MVATLQVSAARTAVQRPADISETLAYARNPFSFVVTLTGTDTFADLTSVRLVLREYPHPATDTPLAEVIWSTPSGTSHTFDFTDAQMNQLAGEDGTAYWAILTVIDPTDGTIVLWRGKLTLVPSYATEDTAPAPATTTKLTLAEANDLYATLTSLDALDTRVTALEDGGTEVWGGITGTLSSQTDLNTALGLKANTASLGTLATQSGTFSGSGTLATGGFTLTVPATGTAALAGTYSNSALNATTIGATTPGTGAFTTLSATGQLLTGDGTAAAPAYAFTSATGTGFYRLSSGPTTYTQAGLAQLRLSSSIQFRSIGGLEWSSSSIDSASDTYLLREAGGVLAMRNGTNAQAFRAYNTYTDASNYERATFGYTSNILRIGTENAGTGTARAINFVIGGTATWEHSAAGHFRPLIDNTFDIGASGATRPRSIYAATSATVGGLLALVTTPTDGVLITNTTAASAGTPVQYSPAISLSGTGWATAAGGSSMAVKFSEYVVPATGSSPTGLLTWDSKVGSAPAATRMTLSTSGNLSPTGSVLSGNGTVSAPAYSFTSTPGIGMYLASSIIRMTTGTVDSVQFAQNMTGGINIRAANGIGFGDTAAFADAIIGRQAAANIRQGSPDAATAVAQTSSVQSVLAGTSNTAGANRTYSGSQGTGSGVGGAHIFQVAPAGAAATVQNTLVDALTITGKGGINLYTTTTAGGTTGNVTIDKPTGTVNIAAAGTTVTVTNALVSATSTVFAVIRTNDTTALIKNVVPGAGSFVINLNAATTAETSIGFFVINP